MKWRELFARFRQTLDVAPFDWEIASSWGVIGAYWTFAETPVGIGAEVANQIGFPIPIAGVMCLVGSLAIIYGLLRPSPPLHIFGIIILGTAMSMIALVGVMYGPDIRVLIYVFTALLCVNRAWGMQKLLWASVHAKEVEGDHDE